MSFEYVKNQAETPLGSIKIISTNVYSVIADYQVCYKGMSTHLVQIIITHGHDYF